MDLLCSSRQCPTTLGGYPNITWGGGEVAEGTLLKEGWLCKQGAGLGARFERCWCVLQKAENGAAIRCFSDERKSGAPSALLLGPGTCFLTFASASEDETADMCQDHPYGFVLEDASQDPKMQYRFDAEGAAVFLSWARAFEAAGIRHAEENASSIPAPTSPKSRVAGPLLKQASRASVAMVLDDAGKASSSTYTVDMETPTSVVIFGASGDLAKKKLYPALYQLMFGCPDAPLLPQNANVVGYARSQFELPAFLAKQCVNVKGQHKERFFKQCSYFQGSYDNEEDYGRLHDFLCKLEGGGKANRIFFFSVNPEVFAQICGRIKQRACAPGGGFTRLIIEKPFGKDSRSFAELNKATSSAFSEEHIYRIDHYLGKEVVLNLVTLRFGNQVFEPVWNRHNIAHVQIVFKEDLGTGGRGGYFDGFGIIRDIMQNHLLQVFEWLAMEPPAALDAEHIRREKTRLLKCVRPLSMEDCFLGQFGRNEWTVKGETHVEPGYLEDSTVPAGSRCPTFAAVLLKVDNERWRGVPFLMRAGKGLDERMAEVRVTFKPQTFNGLVPGAANELVMRIQPDEAIYMKCMNKAPGWQQDQSASVVLDMSYSNSFPGSYVADAYERMFLNTAKGDGSLFVGEEELTEAWRIFTPLLDEIDRSQVQPVIYPFGVRAPAGFDAFIKKYGIVIGESWQEHLALYGKQLGNLREVFKRLDKDGDGLLNTADLKQFTKIFHDGREPTETQAARIMDRLDRDGDGLLTYEEFVMGVEAFSRCCACDSMKDHSSWQ